MLRFGWIKTPVALLALATVSACSQTPAQIVMKGEQYYGKAGYEPATVQMASASTSAAVAPVSAVPIPKPEVSLPVMASREEDDYEPRPSYGFQPSPSTVEVRERSQIASINVKELEPIAAAPAPEQVAKNPVLPEPQARVVAEAPKQVVVAQKPVTLRQSEGFLWPVKGNVITEFGPSAGGTYNDGINIAARAGDPIMAAADGEVVYSGNELRGYGNMVILRHPGGIMTAYAHADKIVVEKGEYVRQGATIATVGSTGGVDQAQVHFGIRKNKEPVDPMNFLSGNSFAAR